MFQGTPGGGLDVLPEMLRAATIESRLKGSTPEESMRALIGLAHMTKQYSPEAIKKLAPAFAFSVDGKSGFAGLNRARGGLCRAATLQSGLEIDPMQTLLLGTALTRAGATNTKSGTWLREMAIRAMPGTSLMSQMMYKKHEGALKELGLSDAKGKPTWFHGRETRSPEDAGHRRRRGREDFRSKGEPRSSDRCSARKAAAALRCWPIRRCAIRCRACGKRWTALSSRIAMVPSLNLTERARRCSRRARQWLNSTSP